MKLFGYHLRRDGCWKEVPQPDRHVELENGLVAILPPPRGRTVLRLLFEWPWQKKDPLLNVRQNTLPRFGPDGLCECSCAERCPLGKTGSSPRCSREELLTTIQG